MTKPREHRAMPAHQSSLGAYYVGDSVSMLKGALKHLSGSVQLLITSPPFPLNHKKSYGNLTGDEYLDWFSQLAEVFANVLTPDGSVVMEIGNAWEPRRPVQSLLPIESLLAFARNAAGLRLCQQFACYNPARLPSPAQWVTVERSRFTDSFTHVWWFAKTDTPKADNRRVLRPYSGDMRALLRRKKYNSGRRPSAHTVSEKGFLKNNGGSIAQNFFEMEPLNPSQLPRLPNAMRFGNTGSNSAYQNECRRLGIGPHPARMSPDLVAFFISFLTDENDIVLDPFAGSNTTGYVAEQLNRRWISVDVMPEYEVHSRIRFNLPPNHKSGVRVHDPKPRRRNLKNRDR